MSEARISISYGQYADKDGKKTILLEVTNQGKEPIVLNKTEWVYFYEKPVDATEEFVAKHGKAFQQATGKMPIKAEETGRRYSFGPLEGLKEGPLDPQESRSMVYPAAWIPEMLSIAQALSPERYWIEITLNENQIEKLNGKTFGGFLEQRFASD